MTHDYSLYLVGLAALGAVLFVAVYALFAPFYKSEEGWNVMAFMVVIAAMVSQAVYFRLTDARAPWWLSYLDWSLVNVAIWWRLTLVVRGQIMARRKE